MKFFYPSYYFNDIYAVTPEFLKKEGIGALLLDVDNTIISNTVRDAGGGAAAWINSMRAAGIKLCILSNGKGHRVKRFNKPFGLPAVHFAAKPLKKGYKSALALLETSAEGCAVIGDQLFTDIWGGGRSGLKTILVNPIDLNEGFFIKVKRLLERPFIKKIKEGKRLT